MNRRVFAQGLGASAFTIPILSSKTARAAEGDPKRLVVFFTPNGTIPEEFFPDGSGTSFRLRRILAPLESHRSDLILMRGLEMKSPSAGPGDEHMKGMGHMLTGTALTGGNTCNGDDCAGYAGGISIDQLIANEIGQNSLYKSVELGVGTTPTSNNKSRMCYAGARQPLPPMTSPKSAFDKLFANIKANDGTAMQPSAASKRSVLDFIKQDFREMQRRIGSEDRVRIERHMDYVREIEQRLMSAEEVEPAPSEAQCLPPNVSDASGFVEVGRSQIKIAAAALACQVTNVVSIQWTQAVGNLSLRWIDGVSGRHHDLSHDPASANPKEQLIRINTWYAEQYRALIEELKRLNIFDTTTVLWCNELATGSPHQYDHMPFVLAGSAGGYFQTGRYHAFNRIPHNNLLVSLANAYGVSIDSFGDERFCTGAISEFRA